MLEVVCIMLCICIIAQERKLEKIKKSLIENKIEIK
ncbi:hypothetical protein DZE40_000955 [Clostridium beijerinckii]|nr:hypothetical protein [Clostridium beijerinckii]